MHQPGLKVQVQGRDDQVDRDTAVRQVDLIERQSRTRADNQRANPLTHRCSGRTWDKTEKGRGISFYSENQGQSAPDINLDRGSSEIKQTNATNPHISPSRYLPPETGLLSIRYRTYSQHFVIRAPLKIRGSCYTLRLMRPRLYKLAALPGLEFEVSVKAA